MYIIWLTGQRQPVNFPYIQLVCFWLVMYYVVIVHCFENPSSLNYIIRLLIRKFNGRHSKILIKDQVY